MGTYALVRPEHLNHYGRLFGGALLKWVDEFAWLVASRDFPGCPLVTVGMDEVVFRQPVASGAILRFLIAPQHVGNTSVRYRVEVFADEPGAQQRSSWALTPARPSRKRSSSRLRAQQKPAPPVLIVL